MTRTFTSADDTRVIAMIAAAQERLVLVAPALTKSVASAVATRMKEPGLPFVPTVILDADAEVYRMGYGDEEALEIIRKANAEEHLDLREQPGVRIGVIIADTETLIYAPAARAIEAGSTSAEKPNAILLSAEESRAIADAVGAVDLETDTYVAEPEIGRQGMEPERVDEMQRSLKETPVRPVDLTRRLNVFVTRIQYVELKVKGYHLSRRRVPLPEEFRVFDDKELSARVSGRIQSPVDGLDAIEVEFDWEGEVRKIRLDEKALDRERKKIEDALTILVPKRGRMILRKRRQAFDRQVNRLKTILNAYAETMSGKMDDRRGGFEEQFVNEFLPRWKRSPPERLEMRLEAMTDEILIAEIRRLATKVFDDAVRLEPPDVSVIYKDIALEDIADEALMSSLREVLENRSEMTRADIGELFESTEAVPMKQLLMK